MLGEWLKELFEQLWQYLIPFVVVNDYEGAVLLRFGRFKKVLTPGFYLKWPIVDVIIKTMIKVDTMQIAPIAITTQDNKTISIGAIIELDIYDVQKYLLEANDARSNIHDIIRGLISDTLEEITWEDIKKKKTINQIKKLSNISCDTLGIRLLDIKFTDKCVTKPLTLFGNPKLE